MEGRKRVEVFGVRSLGGGRLGTFWGGGSVGEPVGGDEETFVGMSGGVFFVVSGVWGKR